jgi:hypothetical protein
MFNMVIAAKCRLRQSRPLGGRPLFLASLVGHLLSVDDPYGRLCRSGLECFRIGSKRLTRGSLFTAVTRGLGHRPIRFAIA